MVTVRELTTTLNVKGNAPKRFERFNLTLTDMKAGLDLIVGVTKVVARGIQTLTTDVVSQGSEIEKWRKRIGISAKELQALEFAGKSVGAEVDNTREAIKTFRENLGEMQRIGTGPAVDALGTLGIALKDIIDLPAEQQFALLGDAFSELENDSQRLSVATEVMGDDGAALLPLFAKGGKGVDLLTKKFDEMGFGLSDAEAALAGGVGGSMMIVEEQINSMKLQIGAELLPTIQELVVGVGGWIKENKGLIKTTVVDFIHKVTAAARKLGPSMIAIGKAIELTIPFIINLITDTVSLIKNIDKLDDLLTEDFGPAWGLVKGAIELALLPMTTMVDFISSIPKLITKAINKLKSLGGTFADVASSIEDALPDFLKSEKDRVKRGAPLTLSGRKVKGRARRTVNFATATAKELRSVVDDKGSTPEQRARASAQFPVTSERERVLRQTKSDIENSAKQLGQDIEIGRVIAARKRRTASLKFHEAELAKAGLDSDGNPLPEDNRRGGGGRGKSDDVSDKELILLIEKAAKSGRSLTDVLGGRSIGGTTPPVIAVTVTNFNFDQDVEVDIDVTGVPGQTSEEIADMVDRRTREALRDEFRKAVEDIEPVAR
jgi:hypothetical protein